MSKRSFNTALLTFIVLALLAGAAYIVKDIFSIQNTWAQNKETGAWERVGSPKGQAPDVAIRDCYDRETKTNLYNTAIGICVARLCATEQVCINDLLDTFSFFRNDERVEMLGKDRFESEGEGDLEKSESLDEVMEVGGSQEEVSETEEDVVNSVEVVEEKEVEIKPSEVNNVVSSTELIKVNEPFENAKLTSPFSILGEASEGVESVIVRVKSNSGSTLIKEVLTPRAPLSDGWRQFKISLAYEFSSTKSGVIEITPEGQAISNPQVISIPVDFD